MGNLKSRFCPVCGGDNGDSKWACMECLPLINLHRELVRNLQQWRAHFEAGEADDILRSSDGREYCLWDVERFYEARTVLADGQSRAIELCLWSNIAERKAAIIMGVSPTTPVSIYATVGLSRLLGMVYREEIPGYRLDGWAV